MLRIFLYYLIPSIFAASCKKFVTLDPPATQLSSTTVFENDNTATAAIFNLYTRMSSNDAFSFSYYSGLSADEFTNYTSNVTDIEINQNNISPENVAIRNLWSGSYNNIYQCNSIMEGLNASAKVSDKVKQQLLGEAKFIRAFYLFYLTNIFGEIPVPLTIAYVENSSLNRIERNKVYEQIVSDLIEAKSLLNDDYVDAKNRLSDERVRLNKISATAFLARVYLYMNEWGKAEEQSTLVLNDSRFELLGDLNNVFLKNSKEAIWQLMCVSPSRNTVEGSQFIIAGSPSSSIANSLLNSFENGDNRRTNWISNFDYNGLPYYYPFKYKIKSITPGIPYTEYSTVLRLAEQYLIRAEARLKKDNISGALEDLNIIRARAGLNAVVSTDNLAISSAISQERKVELFSEWSHRWFDLKRLAKTDEVLSSLKSPNWQSSDILYPIPQTELLLNTKLTQNIGY